MVLPMLLVLLILAAAEAALPLPSFMKKCTSRERAALNACALENARITVAKAADKGDRRYGVAPFDPVFIERMTVQQSGLTLELTNATVYTEPAGSWHIHSVDIDLDKRVIMFHCSCPALILKSKYRLNGRILAFEVRGIGDCYVKSDNVHAWNSFYYDVVKNNKDELQYIKLKSFTPNSNVTKSQYKFNNLFDGQEALSKAIHDVANENWEEINKEIKESVMEALGQFTMSVMQSFFNAVPYKDVFPE